MAKKNKIPLTPEQIAEKKLNSRKTRARVLAVVLAIAITAGVYFAGSSGEHKVVRVEPQAVPVDRVVEKEVTVTVTTPATEAPTTAAPTTAAPATQATTAASGDSSGGGILDSLTGMLGGLTDGLGGITDSIGGATGGLGDVDLSGAADTVEGIGTSAQDFFNGLADKVSGTTQPDESTEAGSAVVGSVE